MPILKAKPAWSMGETKTLDTSLSDGLNGNLETVDIMKRVARERARYPLVRQLALQILLEYEIDSQDYLDEAYAIGDYVKKKVRYVRDAKNLEQLHDPLTMIDQIKRGVAFGDCDDMALLIATLLLSIGHQPYFRCVRYRGNDGPYNHIYIVEYERNYRGPKRRIVIDAILKRDPIGTEVNHFSGEEIPA